MLILQEQKTMIDKNSIVKDLDLFQYMLDTSMHQKTIAPTTMR